MKQNMDTTEYAPYYEPYVKRVPNGDIIEILSSQSEDTANLISDLNEEQAMHRYGEGKWSVKEVIGHFTDTERIMAYRLLAIARGDASILPGFDDQAYVKNAHFDQLSLQQLSQNFLSVRQSTIQLLKSLPNEVWTKSGNANGSQVTVRALAYIIAGHELHHRSIIEERYLRV